MKALRRAEDAMHALILIYIYRTSRIIFREREIFSSRFFLSDNVETFIILELRIIEKEWIFEKIKLQMNITKLHF